MKIGKYVYYLTIGMLGGFGLTGCSNNDPEGFIPTLATVQIENSNHVELDSDSYGILDLQNPEILPMADADSSGQRILAGVQFIDSETNNQTRLVQLVEIVKVLTKKANDLRSEEADIYGNNPIQITSASISKKHLNIQYIINGSMMQKPHRISLVLTENTEVDSEGLLPVEFRHNAEEDWGYNSFWGIVSYTLESIPEYQQENVKGFRIKYNSGANNQAEWIVKTGSSETQSQQRPAQLASAF